MKSKALFKAGSLLLAMSSWSSYVARAEGTVQKPSLTCGLQVNGEKKVAIAPVIQANNQMFFDDPISYAGHTIAVHYLLGNSIEPIDMLQLIVDDRTTSIQDPGSSLYAVRADDGLYLWCRLQR